MKAWIKLFTVLAVVASSASASVSIYFEGGALFAEDVSTPAPDGSLVIAVTSTDTFFGGPVAGSFVSGDDTLLGSWSIDSGAGAAGSFSASLPGIELGAGVQTGQSIAIYWFPYINSLSSLPTQGTTYGFYADSSWLVPADGSLTVSYSLETEYIGGVTSNDLTVASFTVGAIPEPSTFGLLFGLSALGMVACRRGKRA